VDVTVAGFQLARQMPTPRPLGRVLGGWSRVEDALLRELKTRLDRLDVEQAGAGSAPGRSRPLGEAVRLSPAQLLDELLGASAGADSAESRTELYRSLLLRLVPDEARILAALSGGTAYPLLHVLVRANGGGVVKADAEAVRPRRRAVAGLPPGRRPGGPPGQRRGPGTRPARAGCQRAPVPGERRVPGERQRAPRRGGRPADPVRLSPAVAAARWPG
jgi:hypothetical protein